MKIRISKEELIAKGVFSGWVPDFITLEGEPIEGECCYKLATQNKPCAHTPKSECECGVDWKNDHAGACRHDNRNPEEWRKIRDPYVRSAPKTGECCTCGMEPHRADCRVLYTPISNFICKCGQSRGKPQGTFPEFCICPCHTKREEKCNGEFCPNPTLCPDHKYSADHPKKIERLDELDVPLNGFASADSVWIVRQALIETRHTLNELIDAYNQRI